MRCSGDLITGRPNRSQIPRLEFHDVFEGCKCSEVRVPDTDVVLLTVFNFLMLNASKKLMSESFGVVRSGGVMRRPTGLAYIEKILYVLDGLSGQIVRFRLSTDVPR